jgi:hypothetical protein
METGRHNQCQRLTGCPFLPDEQLLVVAKSPFRGMIVRCAATCGHWKRVAILHQPLGSNTSEGSQFRPQALRPPYLDLDVLYA